VTSTYDAAFFDKIDRWAAGSAARVVPILLASLNVESVLDVGCGTGTWLSAFAAHGVTDLVGVDGPWVDRSRLRIPQESFHDVDVAAPLPFSRRFDLALCLEVGEHLPAAAASTLVESLTSAADTVLFSAAIPGQGGADHVNEQWPEYWADLFAARGFLPCGALRAHLWDDPQIAYFYRQNLIMYFADQVACDNFRARLEGSGRPPRLVHPELFAHVNRTKIDPATLGVRDLLAMLRSTLTRRARAWLR
jgi:SAM-dependent methyltransferase